MLNTKVLGGAKVDGRVELEVESVKDGKKETVRPGTGKLNSAILTSLIYLFRSHLIPWPGHSVRARSKLLRITADRPILISEFRHFVSDFFLGHL
jgi:hypothetical protein